MLFISSNDRVAGIEAFLQLMEYMQKTIPEETIGVEKGKERETAADSWDRAKPNEREVMLAIWQSACAPGSYYECHLTFQPPSQGGEGQFNAFQVEEIGAKYHFVFSVILGDEQMGAGTKWYLTRSLSDGATLANDMNALTLALTQAGIPILRRKIEHIIFDERRDQLAGTGRAV